VIPLSKGVRGMFFHFEEPAPLRRGDRGMLIVKDRMPKLNPVSPFSA